MAIYRGAKCPTLKTAEKLPKRGAEWVPVKQPKKSPWTGKSCFSNRALVKTILRCWNAFKYSVLEASKVVSTKTLLLKHYYRRQGKPEKHPKNSQNSCFRVCVSGVFPAVFRLFDRESGTHSAPLSAVFRLFSMSGIGHPVDRIDRLLAQKCSDLPRNPLDRKMAQNGIPKVEREEKTPTPKISALLRKRPFLLRANFVLTKDRKRPYYYRHFCGKIHREGSCSKAAGGP